MAKIFKLFLTLCLAVGLSVGCDDDREVLMVNPGDDSGNTGGVVDTPNDENNEGNGSGGDVNVPEEDDSNEGVGGFSETLNGIVVTWAADVTREQMNVLTALVQNMVYVEGGTFMMGANEGDSEAYDWEKPRHSVTLSGYRIGKYEVTQREWVAVMGSNPSNFKGDNLPVECVSWKVIDEEFLPKLKQMTGLSFRLPTEAEWEYAARGGNRSIGYKYSGGDNIGSVAWYWDNSGSKTHPVGYKQANELGLYDMTGNVWEWCSDWYDSSYYSSSPSNNPQGPSSGSVRVSRGGSWFRNARYCRVSRRYSDTPSYTNYYLGLRLALSVDDSGNDEQGGDIDDSIVYDESDFVGVWEATVVDWDDIYYLRFDKFGSYYESYIKDTDFSLCGQYSVNDNVLSIPYGSAVANGYGTDYIIESVAENSITLKSCDFGDNVIMHKQPDSFEPPMFAMWGEDLQTVGYDEALVTFGWETNCTVGEPMIDAEWVTLDRRNATGARFVVAAFNLPCDSTRIATISIPYTSASGEVFTQELTICQTGKFYFGPADIIGSWSMFMKGTDVSQKADYNFNADGTFTSTSYTISNETGEIMIDEVTGEPMIPIVDEGVYIISEKTEANVKEDALFNIQIGEGGLTFEVLYNFQTLQMTCYLEISQTNPDGSKEILSEISQVYSRK